jgi:hypothetical protein
MTSTALQEMLLSPYLDDLLADGLSAVVVRAERDHPVNDLDAGSIPLVIIGITASDGVVGLLRVFDVVLVESDPSLHQITTVIESNPVAATSLVVLLRGSAALPVDHALAAESAVYSMLQSGAEFARWKAGTSRAPAPVDNEPAVLSTRNDATLSIVLNRPDRHNAFSRSMRDGLSEVLALAVIDDTITRVEISGNGPSFCSGGDLAEFGSFVDPAGAHTARLTRSPARLINRIAPEVHVFLHGACMGAGIELPAFARRVSAHPGSSIALPEVPLGLIPGSGGTVSITRRVGRQRCAQLALTGHPITAQTALEWGLIDEISVG